MDESGFQSKHPKRHHISPDLIILGCWWFEEKVTVYYWTPTHTVHSHYLTANWPKHIYPRGMVQQCSPIRSSPEKKKTRLKRRIKHKVMQSWGMRMCLPVEGTSESRLATDVQGSKSVIEMPAAMVLSSRYRSLPCLWTSVKCHFSLAWFSQTTIPCFCDYSRRWGGDCMEKQRERVRESDRNIAVIGFHLQSVNFHHLDLYSKLSLSGLSY